MNKSVLRLLPLVLVASAFGLAACGGTVIDAGKAEDAIQANLEDQNVKVDSVSCPDDVDVEAGKVFECDVTAQNGSEATAVLKIRNDDADVDFVDLKVKK